MNILPISKQRLLSSMMEEATEIRHTEVPKTTFYGRYLKRIFDLFVCMVLLVPCGLVMIGIAIAIKLDTKGSVIFLQPRHGKGRDIFNVLKFRSMHYTESSEDKRTVQARKGDERITDVGRFIRRYSLDELPQLFNVIKGDMSLVGPRPHAVDMNYHYEQYIEDYWLRHSVRPGITGLAQVKGCRGPTPNIGDMARRVAYDLLYIEHLSFMIDIKILLLTVREIFFPRNAY